MSPVDPVIIPPPRPTGINSEEGIPQEESQYNDEKD